MARARRSFGIGKKRLSSQRTLYQQFNMEVGDRGSIIFWGCYSIQWYSNWRENQIYWFYKYFYLRNKIIDQEFGASTMVGLPTDNDLKHKYDCLAQKKNKNKKIR